MGIHYRPFPKKEGRKRTDKKNPIPTRRVMKIIPLCFLRGKKGVMQERHLPPIDDFIDRWNEEHPDDKVKKK